MKLNALTKNGKEINCLGWCVEVGIIYSFYSMSACLFECMCGTPHVHAELLVLRNALPL